MVSIADLRAITIRRPWADLIASGQKDVENRSWGTTYRGLLLIHAGQGWAGEAEAWFNHVFAPFLPDDYFRPERHPQGIVALAELVDICPGLPCECGPWATAGNRHFRLGNARALAVPVPARGSLGLWRPTPELLAAVRAAEAAQ